MESNYPYASRVVLVKKKDGSFRMCIDYREWNKQTVKDRYSIPSFVLAFDAYRRYFAKLRR